METLDLGAVQLAHSYFQPVSAALEVLVVAAASQLRKRIEVELAGLLVLLGKNLHYHWWGDLKVLNHFLYIFQDPLQMGYMALALAF